MILLFRKWIFTHISWPVKLRLDFHSLQWESSTIPIQLDPCFPFLMVTHIKKLVHLARLSQQLFYLLWGAILSTLWCLKYVDYRKYLYYFRCCQGHKLVLSIPIDNLKLIFRALNRSSSSVSDILLLSGISMSCCTAH